MKRFSATDRFPLCRRCECGPELFSYCEIATMILPISPCADAGKILNDWIPGHRRTLVRVRTSGVCEALLEFSESIRSYRCAEHDH